MLVEGAARGDGGAVLLLLFLQYDVAGRIQPPLSGGALVLSASLPRRGVRGDRPAAEKAKGVSGMQQGLYSSSRRVWAWPSRVTLMEAGPGRRGRDSIPATLMP